MEFQETVSQVLNGEFGACSPTIAEMLSGVLQGNDPYMIGVDFKTYIQAQVEADMIFKDKKELCKRIVTTLSNLGNL